MRHLAHLAGHNDAVQNLISTIEVGGYTICFRECLSGVNCVISTAKLGAGKYKVLLADNIMMHHVLFILQREAGSVHSILNSRFGARDIFPSARIILSLEYGLSVHSCVHVFLCCDGGGGGGERGRRWSNRQKCKGYLSDRYSGPRYTLKSK